MSSRQETDHASLCFMILIQEKLEIPESELEFTASRSSGPGGQHVNKTNSRMTLQFDVEHSPSLSDDQRLRIASRLASRINKDGMLKLHSQQHRSQAANRAELLERFAELLREAVKIRRKRKKTRPTAASKDRRISEKKRRSDIKRHRRAGSED